ncbi:nuclear transport factor 2 family protein [Legionella quateirensis]|uniref:SnoaL-like domain-containing protein n=1 Tax=Legionella quateirensis TaxID=45072 RepID=A0A378KU26_9GAMM|nr:nuclear transport factor 2 family protein [Legionella quateirensis]KTD44509.1 hypothetical protein Lqua_2913 [Legionella quateirensis]STY16997.1 Uncharacterised protein [Legionella quateirensis]
MHLKNQPQSATRLLKQFCLGYNKRDLTLLLDLFTHNATMWGSGIDEYRVGLTEIQEQLERDWSQSEQGRIEIVSFIPGYNDLLWAAALCKAHILIDGTEHVFEQLRGSIVLSDEHGTWKIAHMHASFPDYRNAENNSFPIKN